MLLGLLEVRCERAEGKGELLFMSSGDIYQAVEIYIWKKILFDYS